MEKSVTDFEKMSPRLWRNLSPILGKSVTGFADFVEIRRRLEEAATDFVEIRYRFWVNLSPILPPTLEKSATGFVKLRFQEKANFWEKPGVGGKLEG